MKIKIKSETVGKVEKFDLLTTHNGYQWSGGGCMTLEDIEQLHDFLGGWIDDKKALSDPTLSDKR